MRLLAVLLILYLGYATVMVALHPRFIYPFGPEPFADPAFTRHDLPSGAVIYVAEGAPEAPVVLYFMGNVGYLGAFSPMLDHHRARGRSVVALAYPGGGGLPGKPSEVLLKAQALDAYDAVPAVLPQTTGPIVAHGYSLGSGLALHVAAEREVAGVVLSAPYARLCELMAAQSWLPACKLPFVQRWDNLNLASRVTEPVLVSHGSQDALIDISQGRRLARVLPKATFVDIAGAGHADLLGFPRFLEAIDGFVARETVE